MARRNDFIPGGRQRADPAGRWKAPLLTPDPWPKTRSTNRKGPGHPSGPGKAGHAGDKSGPRGISATPHDGLFRALVSDPGRAAALIRDHVPDRIVGLLADAPPVPLDGSFVDETLRGSQSDVLFKVELASGGPAFVYVLVEHKSYPDPGTPLQLANYMVTLSELSDSSPYRNVLPIGIHQRYLTSFQLVTQEQFG